jgi:hypothetical protein
MKRRTVVGRRTGRQLGAILFENRHRGCADQLPPRTPGSERRAEPVQPEVVAVELRALRHRLQAIEEIQLGIASPGREHEAASLVRLRLPEGPEIYTAVNSVSRHRRNPHAVERP